MCEQNKAKEVEYQQKAMEHDISDIPQVGFQPVAFLKKALNDMRESAKAQHEVDKAKFAAAKTESRARWEEAKAMGRPETHKAMMQAQRDKQIEEANRRKADAEARISKAQR